ncbi:chitotriosidase-1 [Octopus sinensis]|uniref:Chitotriosidase-1 n=1 Tax=Octopus sinensis TaxID=2607531 RepID=A0A7E6EPW2_9MOLL|nr:chitotriosidase-1 [Octopus sinensis]
MVKMSSARICALCLQLCLVWAFLFQNIEGNRKVVCYYSSSANDRLGIGRFEPENIDPYLCTHIIYAFVDMNGLYLKPSRNLDSEYYQRTLALKKQNPQLRVLLTVGGWNIGSKPFLEMIQSQYTMAQWSQNVINYLRRYGFDGLDMDWEFPGARGSLPRDKHAFTVMLKILQDSFRRESQQTGNEKLILTLATASGSYYIGKAYETTEIVKYIDYMLLMTYNYHGLWEKQTGHHSPLYGSASDPPGEQSQLNQVWSINFWLRQGMPRDRLIVGIATYGMSFTLANPAVNGIRAPAVRSNVSADRGGRPGPQTNEAGILSFYEICTYQKGPNPWRRIWLNDMKVPYAYGGDQWVGYDDLESITYKANYIVNNNLGGAFLWSVEMDDFNNVCGYGRYPLIMKIDEILKPWQWTPTVRPTLGPVTTANPVTLFPPSNTFDCSYRLDGIYYVPRDCRLYVLCMEAKAFVLKCPTNTLFDRQLKLCNYKALVKNCNY